MAGNPPPARGRLIAIGIAGAVVVLSLAATGFLRPDSVDTPAIDQARTTMEKAGCTLTTVKAVPNERDHSDVTSPGQIVSEWNTDPPTSGPHYRETVVYGNYTGPVQQARLVHNLEHGGVFIQYGDAVPDEDVEAIAAFYEDHLSGTVVAPYPKLGEKIALGAWIRGSGRGTGVLGLCRAFDETAFATFFDTFQFKGNEDFPPSSMQPGRN